MITYLVYRAYTFIDYTPDGSSRIVRIFCSEKNPSAPSVYTPGKQCNAKLISWHLWYMT